MGPYRTPGRLDPVAPEAPPPYEDGWVLAALPLTISLLRIVAWLVTPEPLSSEIVLALMIGVACGASLARERWRARCARPRSRPGRKTDAR